jgi:glycosyltransferase involved in cell wall biosynthesis
MRIVLSNSSWKWGGVHVVTETLAVGLSARGHDVLLLCRPDSELESRLRGVVRHQGIVSGPDLGPLAIARCASALRRHRAQVVLALMDKDLRLTGVAARLLRIPVVVRRANDRPLRSTFQRFVYRSIASRIVANSAATRATLLGSMPALADRGVDVIYNGIRVEQYRDAPAAPLGLPSGSLAFGFVGRFEERKGLLDLAAAWPRVSAAVPHAYLVLVGRGHLESVLHERFRDQERVVFTGYRSDVPALLHAFDVVVMPSHWEGFGMVAVEAMAAGRPLIATSASSLRELVTDDINGRVVPPRDPHALATGMIELAEDAELRDRLGREGFAIAVRAFTAEHMVGRWEHFLTQTVRQHG